MHDGQVIAVIQFPGVNCEYETRDALQALGVGAEICRWNLPGEFWSRFSGFVLPGGFSYQDRVRAGVIAAKESVLDKICEEADGGKPVLGICNGCQVLVEAGLVPGFESERVELALAPNRLDSRRGYYSAWVHLEVSGSSNMAADLRSALPDEGDTLPLPIAHAEGRFTSRNPEIWERMDEQGQIIFRYVRASGPAAPRDEPIEFPHNPNGSDCNVAGITNAKGNVLAMMPHPERALFLRQVPEDLTGSWGERRRDAVGDAERLGKAGPGAAVLESFVKAVRRGVMS